MKKLLIFTVMMVAASAGVSIEAAVSRPNSIQEFKSQLSNGTVVVFFGTMSCPHCRKFMPIFNEVAGANGNAKFIFAETGMPPLDDLLYQYKVSGPTVKVFKNGSVVATIPSTSLNRETLTNVVQQNG